MRPRELLRMAVWFGLAIAITHVTAEALKASHSQPQALLAVGDAATADAPPSADQ